MPKEIYKTEITDKEYIFDTDDGIYTAGKDLGTVEECADRLLNPPSVTLPYYVLRERAYNDAGLTDSAYIAAIRQVELDGDRKMLDEYIATRLSIKQQFPKA